MTSMKTDFSKYTIITGIEIKKRGISKSVLTLSAG